MEQRRLLRDSLFNVSASALAALLGLITVPLFVSRLPTSTYADWIVTLSTVKIVSLIDFGIGWTIVRDVATEHGRISAERRAHLRSAATFRLGAAAVAALIVSGAVVSLLGDVHGYRTTILLVGALSTITAYVHNYGMAVLSGLRRYDLSGTIVTAEAGANAGGVIIILLAGGTIEAVALWQAFVVTAAMIINLVVIHRLCPEAMFRPVWRWPSLPLNYIRFSLGSQISELIARAFWDVGVLILEPVAGPAAVVTLHIAQKVPLALAGFVSRAAEVTMPAASGLADQIGDARVTVAVASTRIVAALSVPVVLTIWIVAAPFLALWVGSDAETPILVMRIAALAVALHAIGESSRHFLWGSGRIGTILRFQGAGALVLMGGSTLLIAFGRLDDVSFAVIQASAICVKSLALSATAASCAGLSRANYAQRVGRGLPLASIAAFCIGALLIMFWPLISWVWVAVVGGSVTLTFVGLMVAFGLEPEEASALRQLVGIS